MINHSWLMLLNKKVYQYCIFCLLLFAGDNVFSQAENDFGTKDWINDGFEGNIYTLPSNTRKIPDFDTMISIGKIYAKELNVPNRSWTKGFPGVTDRFEWFGIEYKGTFKAKKAGRYAFTLVSDDGSKLFIDDSLIVNNDGTHGQIKKIGNIDLTTSTHKIRVQYFQGPRTQIALQLYGNLEKEKAEIFPGNSFVLTTPEKVTSSGNSLLFWGLLIFILLLIILFIWKRRRKKKKPVVA